MDQTSQDQIASVLQQIEALKANINQILNQQALVSQQPDNNISEGHNLPMATKSGYISSEPNPPYNIPYLSGPYRHRGAYRGGYRGNYRGGYRGSYRGNYRGGYRGRGSINKPKIRNMSLVVNNDEGTQTTGADGTQYVTTVRRNVMELVNKTVFDQEAEERVKKVKIMELKKRILQKEIEKKLKLAALAKNKLKYDYCDWINIYNDSTNQTGLYAVVNGGQKLVPLSLDPKSDQVGITVEANGSIYERLPNGILLDHSKEEDISKNIYCHYYTSTGVCQRQKTCPYKHSRLHVALCRKFIASKCPYSAETCQLSHHPNKHNSPTCLFFLNGYCARGDSCIFVHVKVNPDAKICRPFTLGGWCDRGVDCQYKHIFQCPDYTDYGVCPRGKSCKLSHARGKKPEIQEKIHADAKAGSELITADQVSDILGFSSDEDENENSEENSDEEEYDITEEKNQTLSGNNEDLSLEDQPNSNPESYAQLDGETDLDQNEDFVSL